MNSENTVETDSIIKTTNKYFYVGRTSNYIFFYNTTKKESDVVPATRVKKISFK